MKVLISKKTGIYYYYKHVGDFHCKEGTVKEEEFKSGKTSVFTNTNREFIVFDANDYDKTQKLKRGPQLITHKDLGYIIARTGINKKSFIVEAGGGSGGASVFFAGIAKKMHTYEISEEHCKIIQKNLEFLEIDNLELTNADISENMGNDKEVDLLFLDMPDSQLVLEKDLSGVKLGAFIVCYVPSVTQIIEITKTIAEKKDLYLEEITEVGLRHWKVWERVARPEFRKEMDHTAFLVFIRKV